MTDRKFEDDKAFVIKAILNILPDVTIIAFGSRINGTPKQYSDLDVAVFQNEVIPLAKLSAISEFFSESDLPFKIDIVDGTRITPEFANIIKTTGQIWKLS